MKKHEQRVNKRATDLLHFSIEGAGDSDILRWSKELIHELECQNKNYQYLFLDCGQWSLYNRIELLGRMVDMEMEDEITCVDAMIEYLQIDQESDALFVLASESDIELEEVPETEQDRALEHQREVLEMSKLSESIGLLESELEGNSMTSEDIIEVTALVKKLSDRNVW